jgi:hypothetical protein
LHASLARVDADTAETNNLVSDLGFERESARVVTPHGGIDRRGIVSEGEVAVTARGAFEATEFAEHQDA